MGKRMANPRTYSILVKLFLIGVGGRARERSDVVPNDGRIKSMGLMYWFKWLMSKGRCATCLLSTLLKRSFTRFVM